MQHCVVGPDPPDHNCLQDPDLELAFWIQIRIRIRDLNLDLPNTKELELYVNLHINFFAQRCASKKVFAKKIRIP